MQTHLDCILCFVQQAIREMDIPVGVIINRSGSGDARVNSYCADENIPILAEIPDDRKIAEAYSRGELIGKVFPEYRLIFEKIINDITTRSD